MPDTLPAELQAKATIAAALIQMRYVGLELTDHELKRPWIENEQLVRLNLLTQQVYEAISAAA